MVSIAMIALAVVAAVVVSDTSYTVVGWINAAASFWGNGVIANYRRQEIEDAPTYAWLLSTVSFYTSLVLIVLRLVGVE